MIKKQGATTMAESQLPSSRVPEITALFWAIKILSTAMGEVFSDLLNFGLHLDHGVFLVGGGLVLAASLVVQFSFKKYVPWAYWLVVSLVSIYGTVVADDIHELLGLSFGTTAALFLGILAAIFVVWRLCEKSLSIHGIHTWRREAFYWATVLATFALGTAVGDLTASTFDWGTLNSGLVFTALILLPAIGCRWFRVNKVFGFWFAYILTRPLGASFADWLSSPAQFGGMDLGSAPITAILVALIVALVAFLQVRRNKRPTSAAWTLTETDQMGLR